MSSAIQFVVQRVMTKIGMVEQEEEGEVNKQWHVSKGYQACLFEYQKLSRKLLVRSTYLWVESRYSMSGLLIFCLNNLLN